MKSTPKLGAYYQRNFYLFYGGCIKAQAHLYRTLVECGNSRAADEKSPINQGVLILGENGCVFQFPQNDNAKTDLPRSKIFRTVNIFWQKAKYREDTYEFKYFIN